MDDALRCNFGHHLNFEPLNTKFTSWELFWNIIMATFFVQFHIKIIREALKNYYLGLFPKCWTHLHTSLGLGLKILFFSHKINFNLLFKVWHSSLWTKHAVCKLKGFPKNVPSKNFPHYPTKTKLTKSLHCVSDDRPEYLTSTSQMQECFFKTLKIVFLMKNVNSYLQTFLVFIRYFL